jgi:hypothetical protein
MQCPICHSLTFHGPMNTKQQNAVLKDWFGDAMQSCFPDADETIRRGTGFSNPIGQSFQQAMSAILANLPAAEEDLASLRAPLDRIVRVLAVQGLPAGTSVRFLFLLRNRLESAPDIPAEEKRLWIKRLDGLAEIAVEIWCECRETLWQLRLNSLRNRIQQLEAGSTPKERGGTA